jgi:hypothetical protein
MLRGLEVATLLFYLIKKYVDLLYFFLGGVGPVVAALTRGGAGSRVRREVQRCPLPMPPQHVCGKEAEAATVLALGGLDIA